MFNLVFDLDSNDQANVSESKLVRLKAEFSEKTQKYHIRIESEKQNTFLYCDSETFLKAMNAFVDVASGNEE